MLWLWHHGDSLTLADTGLTSHGTEVNCQFTKPGDVQINVGLIMKIQIVILFENRELKIFSKTFFYNHLKSNYAHMSN